MEQKYRVVYSGSLLSDSDQEDVISNFMKLTKRDREQAEQFLLSGKAKLINKNLDRETAEKYLQAFIKIGMDVELVGEQAVEAARVVDRAAPVSSAPPEPTRKKAAGPDPGAENPYAPPKAGLKTERMAVTGGCRDLPEKVSASSGWRWIKDAFSMFIAKPWTWLAIFLVAGIIIIVTAYILPMIGIALGPLFSGILSFVGSLLNMFVTLLIGGGIMLGAHGQAQGETLTVSCVFKGFTTENRNQLLMAAVWYLLLFVGFGLVIALIVWIGGFSMFTSGTANPDAMMQAMMDHGFVVFLFVIFCILLTFAIMMAYWFAIPLIAICGHKALAAYSLSLRACLKNWVPFLVYGLVFLLIGIVTMMVISFFSGILMFAGGTDRAGFFAFVPLLTMLVLVLPSAIIGALSIYTGFRDIFYQTA